MEQPYQVSWWDDPDVGLEAKDLLIWIIGDRPKKVGYQLYIQQLQMKAAVMASSPEEAKQKIQDLYEESPELEWIFVQPEHFGWSPSIPSSCPIYGSWSQKAH